MWTSTLRVLQAELAPELGLADAGEVVALTAAFADFLTSANGDAGALAARASALGPALQRLQELGARFAGGDALAVADLITASAWAHLFAALEADWSSLAQPRLVALAGALAPLRVGVARFPFAAALGRLASSWTAGDDTFDLGANLYIYACLAIDQLGPEALYRQVLRTMRPRRPFVVVFFGAAIAKERRARAPVAELTDGELECLSMLDNFYWIDRPDEK
jgi:hypothetical protein